MKNFLCFGNHPAILAYILLSVVIVVTSFRLMPSNYNPTSFNGEIDPKGDRSSAFLEKGVKMELTMELYPMGSSLPDCSHACGPCMPCKRVKVSFKCPGSESCPIVYKCMCKGKYYHVPSN